MGGQLCPNCKRGFLISKGKRKKRCSFCGYIKYKSPNGRGRDIPDYEPVKPVEKADLPTAPKDFGIGKMLSSAPLPKGVDYTSEEYQKMKFQREEQLREQRKYLAIQKELERLRKLKYNKIKRITIDGEMWDVETGERVADKEAKKRDGDESSPDRIIEDLVFQES